MYQQLSPTSGCCFESNGMQINPLSVSNTFPAGGASEAYCDDFEPMTGCVLATAYMPMQTYRAGYCPDQALQCGTMFPELVRPWFE